MIRMITFSIIIYNFIMLYKRNRVMSSSSVWLLCYCLIFILYPTLSVLNFENKDMIDFIALLGIIFFSMGSYIGNRVVSNKNKSNIDESEKKYLVPKFGISLITYIISFFLSIIVYIKLYGSGNLLALFTGKVTSKQLSLDSENSSMLILIQYIMIPCILCMWVTAKDKKKKLISIITLVVYLVFSFFTSFTRIFMISIIIMIFFHEMLKKDKKKQAIYSICLALMMTFLLIIMNFIRCLGLSYKLELSTILDLDMIFECTDFSAAYIMFNNLVAKPSPYISPIVYLKPLFIFIPRWLWADKPETLNVQVLQYLDPAKAKTGYSTGFSILGEGYAIMGLIGYILFPFIWGVICANQDKKYYDRIKNNRKDSLKNIFYYIFSILIIISAQRGDWSVYLTIIIYSFYIPAYLLSKISIGKEKKNE